MRLSSSSLHLPADSIDPRSLQSIFIHQRVAVKVTLSCLKFQNISLWPWNRDRHQWPGIVRALDSSFQ
jgi:hypothetical protein